MNKRSLPPVDDGEDVEDRLLDDLFDGIVYVLSTDDNNEEDVEDFWLGEGE